MNLKLMGYALLGLLLTLIKCSSQEVATLGKDVLASFDGGTITTQAIDNAILALAPSDRIVTREERLAWYERLARDLAIGKILINEARQKGSLDRAIFQKLAHQAARQITTDDFLRRNLPPIPQPSEAEFEQLFKENFDDGHRPARALVFNIFLRFRSADDKTNDKTKLTKQLNSLRQRVLNGENFGQLAATHSDSESRHRNGRLGFLQKDTLPPDLQTLIFSLEENTPSEPVFTKDGGHLFMAEAIIPEKTFSIGEVRHELMTLYFQRSRLDQILELAQQFVKPVPYNYPNKDAFSQLFTATNLHQTLMKIGHFEMTFSDFSQYLQSGLGRQPNTDGWKKAQLYLDLQELALREWLYQALRSETDSVDPPHQLAFESKRDQLWAEHLIRQELLETLLNAPKDLKTYFQNQKVRFNLPPKVKYILLTIPPSDRDAQMMGQMESQLAGLRKGDIQLETWAKKWGGTLATSEYLSAHDLVFREPQIMVFAFQIKPGDFSPPFRRPQGLSIFQVKEQLPPKPQPFSQVRSAVAQDYLHHQGQKLYQDYAAQRLLAANFLFDQIVANAHGRIESASSN